MTAGLLSVFSAPPPEGIARLREARIAASLLCGSRHPVTVALRTAIADPKAIDVAIDEIDALPALTRRRLLAAMAAA